MAKDFRASQIQTNQIVSSGSSGTNAKIIIYPVDKQSTGSPNQGIIDSSKFNTSSIGNDVFLYVSGGIGDRNSNNPTISVFGGDVYISGNISAGSGISGGGSVQWVESSTSPRLRTTASVAIGTDAVFAENVGTDVFFYVSGTISSGSATDNVSVFGGSVRVSGALLVGSSSISIDSSNIVFSSGSEYRAGGIIKVADTANGIDSIGISLGLGNGVSAPNNITLKAGTTIASGSGGSVIITAGNAGWKGADGPSVAGGAIVLTTGHAAHVTFSGGQPSNSSGNGGDVTFTLGSGSISFSNKKSGAGGGFSLLTGTGGAAFGGGSVGAGGAVSIQAGPGGDGIAGAGDGGDITIFAGSGGAQSGSTGANSGFGGSITINAANGGANNGSGRGARGGDLSLSPGAGGYGAYDEGIFDYGIQEKAGDLLFVGGASSLPYSSASISGSNLEVSNFNRIFFNGETDWETQGFPGRDIGFYVSGTIGTVAGAIDNTRKAVFGGDVVISGNLTIAGTSSNPSTSIPTVELFTGTTYNVTDSDNGKIILCVSATLVRVTGSATPGVTVEFIQSASLGQITFNSASQYLSFAYPSTFISATNERWSNGVITVMSNSVGSKFVSLRGDLQISPTSSLITTFITIGSYLLTNTTSSNPEIAGQLLFSTTEVDNSNVRLRSILCSTGGSVSASVRLYNITSGAYVEIGGAGITTLGTANTTPSQILSVNLLGATNFSTGSNIYEVQVYTDDSAQSAVHGSSMFICS
jgi:hypothetical protein